MELPLITFSMDVNHTFIMDLVDSIEAQEMEVEQYYPESGYGLYEVTIKYGDAMKAANNHIRFRETLYTVSLKHGLLSSFST